MVERNRHMMIKFFDEEFDVVKKASDLNGIPASAWARSLVLLAARKVVKEVEASA